MTRMVKKLQELGLPARRRHSYWDDYANDDSGLGGSVGAPSVTTTQSNPTAVRPPAQGSAQPQPQQAQQAPRETPSQTAPGEPPVQAPRASNVPVKGSPPIDYTPGNFAKNLRITPDQYNAYREGIAKIEGARYNQMGGSSSRYAGRYQMGPSEIQQTAHQLNEPPPSTQQYLNDPQMQERYFERYTLGHHNQLMGNPKYANASPEDQLKILGYAHNQGAGGPKTSKGAWNWLNTGVVGYDGFKTPADRYSNVVGQNLKQLAQQGASPQASAQPSTSAPASAQPQRTASNSSPYLAIGDSLALGVGKHLGNTNYAQGGWNPELVHGLVNKAVKNGDVQGKHVILSGGASNAGGNSDMVSSYYPKMIQSLKDGGASQVSVMGVGPYSHYDNYKYNDTINQAAKSGGVNFTGPLAKIAPFKDNTVNGGVHPNDYRPIVNYVQKNFSTPTPPTNVASTTPTPSTPSTPTPTPSTPSAQASATPTPTPTPSSPTPPRPLQTASADIDRPIQNESLRRVAMQLLRPRK